jgi:pimeloyl-ACP methyl ester carboxylesterase
MVKTAIVLAPHIFVEEQTIQNIQQAKILYESGSLKQALSRYHDDVDSAFWGWNTIWLKPEFKDWDITSILHRIRCPLLAVQGTDDPYGTMAQVYDIAKYVDEVKVVEIPKCGHSPHRDQPFILNETIKDFVKTFLRN